MDVNEKEMDINMEASFCKGLQDAGARMTSIKLLEHTVLYACQDCY